MQEGLAPGLLIHPYRHLRGRLAVLQDCVIVSLLCASAGGANAATPRAVCQCLEDSLRHWEGRNGYRCGEGAERAR